MTILTATSAGQLSGYFDIPADVPAGSKQVQFYGASNSGSYAEATFVGRGQIQTRELHRVVTINLSARFVDPVAETFTLPVDRMIGGVRVKFSAGGTSRVIAQIRECSNGFPTARTITDGSIPQSAINTASSAWTEIALTPSILQANQEYALVLLCDDATTAVRVATLGQFDSVAQQWITEQPYQIGVLLKSSNASTWTPDQTSDLAFQLLEPTYTPLNSATSAVSKTIALSSCSATSADIVLVMAAVERPMTGCDCQFEISTYPNSATTNRYIVREGEPLTLPTQYSGPITCSAILTGTLHSSPILYPAIQLVTGCGRNSGTSITRSIPCGATSASSSKMTVNMTAILPQGSDVTVQAQIGTNASNLPIWGSAFSLVGTPVPVGNNAYERVYTASGFSVSSTKVLLTLTGTPQAQPVILNVQAYCVSM